MKTLIVNHTKKPSAVLVDGARTCAIKAEDLNAKRGTSCKPDDCETLLGSHPYPIDYCYNFRQEALGNDGQTTLENLAQSALKWFTAHLRKAMQPNSPRLAMMLDYDLSRTIHVIVTADIATNRESLRIYKTTLKELLDDTAIPEEVLTVRGYETNLELMLLAMGDGEYRFEERCRFHDRAPMAFDLVTSANERKVRDAMDTLVDSFVKELLNPTLLDAAIPINDALSNAQVRVDRIVNLAGLRDTQSREQLLSWMCKTFTVEAVKALMDHYHMDCVLLAGAPFFNTLANTEILDATPGLFSVAPFDAQLGAMLHQLPDEVLAGNMCICTRDIDSFDNVQGNDPMTAREVTKRAYDKGYALVIQGNAGLLDCINGHDLILVKEQSYCVRAAQVINSPVMAPWKASHKPPTSLHKVIGSDEYGLIQDSVDGARVLTLQQSDLLYSASKAEGSLLVLPLKHYVGGAANLIRYGETLLHPDLTIVEHD